MTFAETVNKVIELSAARRDYWAEELPRRFPDYPFVDPDADRGPLPPAEVELRGLLDGLPAEDLNRLGALMYYGREYSPTTDFGEQYRLFVEDFPEPDWAAEWLTKFPSLADELLDALEVLPKAGLDLDAVRAVAV